MRGPEREGARSTSPRAARPGQRARGAGRPAGCAAPTGGARAAPGRAVAARRRPEASLAAGGRFAGSVESIASTSWVSGFGSSGRALASGGAPRPMRLVISRNGPEPNGCRPGERLPEENARRPDVRLGPGRLAGEALRRDVRERSGHVALRGQRLLLPDEREAEVEDPHRAVLVGEQDVRGLHVAVDDAARVRVGEPVENLRCRLDRRFVVELAALERVPERAARDVLVGDVDVTVVAGERVGAQAGGVPELRGGGRLALGARAGGACAGDDLERHLAALALVERVPDRAHPAAAERAQGPVAAEYEAVSKQAEPRPPPSPERFPADARTPLRAARGMGYASPRSFPAKAHVRTRRRTRFRLLRRRAACADRRRGGRAPARASVRRRTAAAAGRRGDPRPRAARWG